MNIKVKIGAHLIFMLKPINELMYSLVTCSDRSMALRMKEKMRCVNFSDLLSTGRDLTLLLSFYDTSEEFTKEKKNKTI